MFKGQGNNEDALTEHVVEMSLNIFPWNISLLFQTVVPKLSRDQKVLKPKMVRSKHEDYSLNKLTLVLRENIDMEIIDKLIFHNTLYSCNLSLLFFITSFFKILLKCYLQFYQDTFRLL